MDYFKLNGQKYEVIVSKIEENFTILYSEQTGRTMDVGAPIVLSPLGTFIGHKVTIARKNGYEDAYDKLYNLVSTPLYVSDKETDGIDVEIVHCQETIKYRAYVSQGARALKRIDEATGKVYWGELQLNIVPIEAQIKPLDKQ